MMAPHDLLIVVGLLQQILQMRPQPTIFRVGRFGGRHVEVWILALVHGSDPRCHRNGLTNP